MLDDWKNDRCETLKHHRSELPISTDPALVFPELNICVSLHDTYIGVGWSVIKRMLESQIHDVKIRSFDRDVAIAAERTVFLAHVDLIKDRYMWDSPALTRLYKFENLLLESKE